jgi:hypothetical protein
MTDSLFQPEDVISSYTRAQAIEDGVLVDVTEWASADKGFHGGFRIPVALTAAVWAQIEDIPTRLEGLQDIRGRAHDVLWMASLACRRHARESGDRLTFRVIMPTSGRSGHAHKHYVIMVGPGDAGEPVATILLPDED